MEQIAEFLKRDAVTIMGHTESLGGLLLILFILVFGYFLVRWINAYIVKRLTAKKVGADVVHLVRRIFYVVAYTILILTVLDLLQIPLTAFAFVSGAIAIGVGFGAQNIINNFISGWILMWERPIRIGDYLEIGDQRGTVESIDTRSTRIRRPDGVHILIPNSNLLENSVVNWTIIDKITRSTVRVGLAYGSPTERIRELLQQVVSEHDDILTDPAPVIVFEDFGDSALVFDTYFWVNVIEDRDLKVIRSDIRFRIDQLMKENDIVIAFPQRDIHIDGAIRIDK